MDKKCFQCGKPGFELYGYTICDDCKSKLGLLTDKTIDKHLVLYKKKNRSYKDEIRRRLDFIDRDYLKKRIKLLHVLELLERT